MIIEDKGHVSIDDPIEGNPVDDLEGAGGGSRGGEGGGDRDGQRVYWYEESPKKVLSPISRMSQIDPGMIWSRSEGIRSVVLIRFLILSREDLWILRAWSQGLLNPPKGPRFLSRPFKHFFRGEEPVVWFSRVSQLGRNRGYGNQVGGNGHVTCHI